MFVYLLFGLGFGTLNQIYARGRKWLKSYLSFYELIQKIFIGHLLLGLRALSDTGIMVMRKLEIFSAPEGQIFN